MTKIKVQEAAKELENGAGRLLGKLDDTLKVMQEHLQALRVLEDSLRQKEEARRQELQRQEQEAQQAREEAERLAAEAAQEAAMKEALRQQRAMQQEQEAAAAQEKEPESAPVQASEKETTAPQPTAPAAPKPAAAQPATYAQRPQPQAAAGPRPQPGRPQQGRQPYAPRPFVPNPNDPNAAINRGKNLPAAEGTRPAPGAPRPQGAPRAQGAPRPFPPKDDMRQGGAPRPGMGPRPGGGPGGARPSRPAPGGGGFAAHKGPELLPTVEKERVSNYDPNRNNYQRVYDTEKKVPRDKKTLTKESIAAAGGLDDDMFRQRRRPKKQQPANKSEPIKVDKAYMTAETITVKDLTERIGKPAGEIIKKLFLLGIMATINQELDYDTAQLVASEFGVELILKLDKTYEETLADEDFEDQEGDLQKRPPVVTVMGHVDHGKTSLLDAIRRTNVTASEHGGITQHIGAYTVTVKGEQITFIDTPGHEAFTAMRARGAQVTDIAIIVVAADDGIMPQTVEAINHAKAAEVPIIVAINKMDRPTANPDRVMQELTEYSLLPEEWGGDTIVVQVSATQGTNIDKLLEMILLVAEMRELKANPKRLAKGTIIEAELDKGRGPVATVLVQNGTLRVGDTVVAGTAYGRIRAMVDDKGRRVNEAGPSIPVEVIGFSTVPDAGDVLNVVEDDRLSRQVAEERRDRLKAEQLKTMSRASLDDLFTQMSEGDVKDLNLIIKADVQGSVEAVRAALERLSNDEVKVRSIHGGVGAITETDVTLASASNAIIIGFNVRPDAKAREAAEREKVDVRLYRIIYQAIEEIQAAMKGMLAPKFREALLGHAQIRQVFHVTGAGTVAGCYVTDGQVRRNASVRLLRDNVVVYEGKLDSLKRFKDDAREVNSGYECGMTLENFNDMKEGDVVECFVMEEIPR